MENKIIRLKTSRKDIPSPYFNSAKWGYSTRRASVEGGEFHLDGQRLPKAGDLVLAKVKRLGQHKRLELVNGRRARIFIGDAIVVAYGNRYAPDQFEAVVPEDLGPCHLIAAGGIAGQLTHKHERMSHPTAIEPVGILTNDEGRALNLKDYAIAVRTNSRPLPPVIAVVGGSMNTGKTTAAASLVHGLTLAGFNVSAGKVTGTGSGCDVWHMMDAGAHRVMDFLDAGYPSTYLVAPSEITAIFETLLSHLNAEGTDFIILEVADGLFQTETSNLIASDQFRRKVDAVLYTASDALSAVHGVEMLHRWGVPVYGVSGLISRSPLGMREVLDAINIPVLAREVLVDPVIESHVAAWLDQGTFPESAGGIV